MSRKKVITFVGMPGAGKSVCVDHLTKLGLPSVYFGGITIDEVKARGLEVNETNEKIVREDIRAKEGKGAYAERMAAKIKQLFEQKHPCVVADGLYSWTEYRIFKETFGDDAVIIAVVAPRRVRHERLAHRPLRPLGRKEVELREYAEIENIEKGGPIANADYFLLNDDTSNNLLEQLSKLLDALGIHTS